MKNQTRQNYHFRELPSRGFREMPLTRKFRRFATRQILSAIELTGYKLDEKKRVALHAIHNLVSMGVTGGCIDDSRDISLPGVKFRTQVWDAIIAAGFADLCRGSEKSGFRTRYRATDKLLELQEEWTLQLLCDTRLERNTEREEPTSLALVCVHTGKRDLVTGRLLPAGERKQPLSLLDLIRRTAEPAFDGTPDPKAVSNGLQHFRVIEDLIESINRSNTSHVWQCFDERKHIFQPLVCLRQIHSGDLGRAARLYTWGDQSGQNLPKATRQTMLIDKEPVAELDFSGMATRMLYHLCRLDPDPQEDIYRPELIFPRVYGSKKTRQAKLNVVRGFVKRITNICWNASTRGKANSAVARLLAKHEMRDFLREVVYDREQSSPGDLVDRVIQAHPVLHEHFFSNAGIRLMTMDGHIMLRILLAFSSAGKPALGIHDAVVCKASDAAFAHRTMSDCYQEVMQFLPVIHRVY